MTSTTRARHGHETLVYRLTEMLVKLNRGEHLEPRALAEEFKVDLRTVQRDLNQRFAYLDLVKEQGRYRMNPAVLGGLTTKDIERFALASGTASLFPTLSHAFVRELLREDQASPLLVRGHHFEDVAEHAATFAVCPRPSPIVGMCASIFPANSTDQQRPMKMSLRIECSTRRVCGISPRRTTVESSIRAGWWRISDCR